MSQEIVVTIKCNDELCAENCPFRRNPKHLPADLQLHLQDDWEFCTLFMETLEPDYFYDSLRGVHRSPSCARHFMDGTH